MAKPTKTITAEQAKIERYEKALGEIARGCYRLHEVEEIADQALEKTAIDKEER